MAGSSQEMSSVRLARVLRKELRAQQVDCIVSIGLIEPHHVRAGRESAFLQPKLGAGALHLDALRHQQSDELRNAPRIALISRNEEGERRLAGALAPGIQALLVEVVQERFGLLSGDVERRERGSLHVVHVVACRPAERSGGGRFRPIPFPAGLVRVRLLHQRLGGTVAEGLVAAAHGVVVEPDRVEKHVREVVAEIPGPHPGHAEGGERGDLVKAHFQALIIAYGIDVIVDRPRAVPGDEQRHAFMQIVHHRRMPVEEHALHGLGGLVRELNGIAVDVDHRIA